MVMSKGSLIIIIAGAITMAMWFFFYKVAL